MFELLPVNDKNIFAFKASGKLTDADYQQFLPGLEALIRESGRLSLYVELEDFQGWEPRAAWDDLRFDLQHDRDFKRIAIVGDKTWEHAAIALTNLFTHSKMRFFDKNQSKTAWEWLQEKPEREQLLEPVQPYKYILLATDFSLHSERAALRARELANVHGAQLEVLYIAEDMIFYTNASEPINAGLVLDAEAITVQAEENMRRFIKRTGLGTDVTQQIQWGNPRWAIVSWAREKHVDMIVMGSHGRRGLGRLLGSVSNAVLHQAPCDVLVIKP
ncbi:hypothetical protein MNBD_GAMMA13-1714 [hydrothermal vent metagenome]|uniref:UspA domain-containing protein n=1 Tax=hydrothermal vent metagenome TaxID=652676 RepID=A0A3B0YUF3_9ZZZZ